MYPSDMFAIETRVMCTELVPRGKDVQISTMKIQISCCPYLKRTSNVAICDLGRIGVVFDSKESRRPAIRSIRLQVKPMLPRETWIINV